MPCAMNANEISPRAGARLNRIKRISQIIKVMFLFYLVLGTLILMVFVKKAGSGGTWRVFGGSFTSLSDIPAVVTLLAGVGGGLRLLAAATFYRLLNLYEKGIIFSAANVRLLKRIGYLVFGCGLLNVCGPVIISGKLSVFQLLVAAVSSPWVIGGLFLVMIAWIMDEGRKLQEEQELTV
jgi:hypothetical protein